MSSLKNVDRLQPFITQVKARGGDDAAIATMLRNEGWSDASIQAAMASHYRVLFGADVPARGGRGEGAREAFLFLLSFALLSVWAFALVALADLLTDRAFPNPIDAPEIHQYFRQAIAGYVASLIVAFPLFLWINVLVARESARRPEALHSGIRKWLTYIALVLTAGALVGDAVWFLTTLLTGDLTSRFVVKAVILLAVAGGIFWYYLATIRSDVALPAYNRAFAALSAAAVGLAIVLGFFWAGSPAYQNAISADRVRIEDLAKIAGELKRVSSKTAAPSLGSVSVRGVRITDPVTHHAYGYVRGARTQYRLCAVFETSTLGDQTGTFWSHPRGPHCFAMDSRIDPPATP
ncbi:MAG: hypothetical protein NVS9B12_02700 [Vulcanimicrobiaceae bacterium]